LAAAFISKQKFPKNNIKMIHSTSTKEKRDNKTVEISAGFIVVGGGMAGTCAAITAARKGVKVSIGSGPAGIGRKWFERSSPVDFGSNLAHGQQQPVGA
jgi:heterodisulfide reductase subunit A-like polyferredoxin